MKYIQTIDGITLAPNGKISVLDTLPIGNYYMERTEQGFTLKPAELFTIPKKMYGDLSVMVDRIVTTACERTASTGVLLSGVKGSGKTMVARAVALQMMQRCGMSCITLRIDQLIDPECIDFVQRIETPCTIREMSFDMLTTLVEECNRFKAPPSQVIHWLNILPTLDGLYKVTGYADGVMDPDLIGTFTLDPSDECDYFDYEIKTEKEEDGWLNLRVYAHEFKSVQDGVLLYEKELAGKHYTFKAVPQTKRDLSAMYRDGSLFKH